MRARDLGIAIGDGVPAANNAITDVAGRARRSYDADRRRLGAHRRDGGRSARDTPLRRLPPAQRQRRADRARVGARVGSPHDTDRHHEHLQRRCCPRRDRRGFRRRGRVVATRRRRDLRRLPQRHPRPARHGRARTRRARRRARRRGRRGKRRRRHRHGVPRVQGWDRNGLAHGGRLRRRRSRPGELRPAPSASASTASPLDS